MLTVGGKFGDFDVVRELGREKELYRLQGQGAGGGKTVERDAC